jgi:hypothetical protein
MEFLSFFFFCEKSHGYMHAEIDTYILNIYTRQENFYQFLFFFPLSPPCDQHAISPKISRHLVLPAQPSFCSFSVSLSLHLTPLLPIPATSASLGHKAESIATSGSPGCIRKAGLDPAAGSGNAGQGEQKEPLHVQTILCQRQVSPQGIALVLLAKRRTCDFLHVAGLPAEL